MNGETDATLEYVSAKIQRNTQKQKDHQADNHAVFKVRKTGNRSVIGVARVFCNSGGEEVEIGRSGKTFAVYAEGEFREEKLPVNIPAKGCKGYRLDIKGHPDDVLARQQLINQTF